MNDRAFFEPVFKNPEHGLHLVVPHMNNSILLGFGADELLLRLIKDRVDERDKFGETADEMRCLISLFPYLSEEILGTIEPLFDLEVDEVLALQKEAELKQLKKERKKLRKEQLLKKQRNI